MSMIKLHIQGSADDSEYVLQDVSVGSYDFATFRMEDAVIADVKVFDDVDMAVQQPLGPAFVEYLRSPAASDLEVADLLERLG